MTGLWLALGVLAGVFIASQAPVNAGLARAIGSPIAAAAISFAAGGVVLVVAALVTSRGGALLRWEAPQPWQYVAGGLLGAVYVTSAIVLTPRLGAAAVMGLAVTGQLLAGLVLDHYGLFGLAQNPVSPARIAGALLLVAGVGLVRFG